MTRLLHLLLASTACLSFILSGCQEAPESSLGNSANKDELLTLMKDSMIKAKATKGLGQPAMWSYSDADTKVYLYGTVHLLKPDTIWRSPDFESALAEADTLILEADVISPGSGVILQNLIREYGVFSDDQTLSSVLDDETKAAVTAALKANNIPIAAVETMKPWLVSLQLNITQILSAGYNPQSGVETMLIADAKQKDKNISFLESAETQIKALGGASIEDQIQGLIATMSTSEIGTEFLDVLVSEWADGDVIGIAAMMANPAVFGSENAYDDLLKTRNKNWVPGLKALLDAPGTKFVAVGAGHLTGPDSVIKMLKQDGVAIGFVN